jgi:hypothetical protein
MDSLSVLGRILEFVRAFRPERPTAKRIPRENSTSEIRLKNDDALIAFIRAHADDEGEEVYRAIRSIKGQDSLVTLAIDPDQQPYIRIAALSHIGAAGDSVRVLIARADHDPAVAIVALQTLFDRKRAREAVDSKHDIVKLYMREILCA